MLILIGVVVISGLRFLYFMESQNGDVRRDLWNHLIQLKQICLEAVVQQQFQEAFECLWGWWLHSLWVTCASAQSSSQEKTVFTCSGRISCFSVCAHCSLCSQDACRCQVVLPQQWPLGYTTGYWPQTQPGATEDQSLGCATQPAFSPCQFCFTSTCFRFASYWR